MHEEAPTDEVDLVAVGSKVIIDLAPIALEAGYELAFTSAFETLIVRGDMGAIERAMINLVQTIVHGGGKGVIQLSVLAEYAVAICDEGPVYRIIAETGFLNPSIASNREMRVRAWA